MRRHLIALFAAAPIAIAAREQAPALGHTGFIPDQGQFADAAGHHVKGLRYLYRGDGLNVQLRDGGFSYDLWNSDAGTKDIRIHRIDVELVGSDTNAPWEASGASEDVLNWYNEATGPEGVTGVHHYSEVVCRGIYPHIDLAFRTTDEGRGVKYDFIVRPGGDPSSIRMAYGGARAEANAAAVLLTWADGSLEDRMPESYWQGTRTHAEVDLRCTADGLITYALRSPWEGDRTLVIDPVPTRQWGTYYGHEDHHGDLTCVAIDGNGNVIAGGTANSTGLASSGAYDQTLSSEDGLLVKFSPTGTRLWATYYGGTGVESGQGVAVDENGSIYFCGSTWSTGSIATAGAHQTTLASGPDGFLVKFNSNGTRAWGTYYGGTLDDRATCVTVDAAGNPAIGGNTNSLLGIATTGAPDVSYGGAQDAFFCKFSPNGVRMWATYLGGGGFDEATAVSNDNAWFYITGSTESTSGIALGPVHQPALNTVGTSDHDAFLVKYSNNGIKSWGTYYGGNGAEYGTACLAELQTGNVYLAGKTYSTQGIATTGAFQGGFSGGGDSFLVKVDATCTRQWGTYIGGSHADDIHGLSVGAFGRLILAGSTDSPDKIATTNAMQTTLAGATDAFAMCFTTAGARLWGTYYGDANYDAAHGLAVSGFDFVLVGMTASPSGLSTPGAFQINANIGPDKYGKFVAHFTTPLAIPQSMTTGQDATAASARFEDRDLVITVPNTGTEETPATLRVMDAMGRIIHEERTVLNNGQARIDRSDAASGVYVITVEAGQERWSTRVVRP